MRHAGQTRARAAAALAAALLVGACGAAVVRQERTAQVSDVDGEYLLANGTDAGCPEVTVISGTTGVNRGVGFTPVVNIFEDGGACDGGTMYTVTETVARNQTLLNIANLGFGFSALQQNAAALQVVRQPRTTEVLVGFDDGPRECPSLDYPATTIYIFVKAGGPQTIRVGPEDDPTLSFEVAADEKALFVISPSPSRMCISTTAATFLPEELVSPTPSATPGASPGAVTGTLDDDDDDAEPSTSASPSPTEDDGSACFPADARATLASGESVPMSALRVGDTVVSGPGETSDIIMFTHADPDASTSFVELTTASTTLRLSPGHYLPVDGSLVPASSVHPGALLTLATGAREPVTRARRVPAAGLYNPQTLSGTVCVDGVLASTYTTAVHPALAHGALLAPRWLYALGARAPLAALFARGSPALAALLPSGPAAPLA